MNWPEHRWPILNYLTAIGSAIMENFLIDYFFTRVLMPRKGMMLRDN